MSQGRAYFVLKIPMAETEGQKRNKLIPEGGILPQKGHQNKHDQQLGLQAMYILGLYCDGNPSETD